LPKNFAFFADAVGGRSQTGFVPGAACSRGQDGLCASMSPVLGSSDKAARGAWPAASAGRAGARESTSVARAAKCVAGLGWNSGQRRALNRSSSQSIRGRSETKWPAKNPPRSGELCLTKHVQASNNDR
jgi:hypothetical protein